ncbi:MAG: helix-turn-helix domain-containing protein [Alicyclobacillaceae bacterium]|nr:helix-turn-helix domain-containing protein [Alicyclobacillaceae bacterium]
MHQECPIEKTLQVIGKKWMVLIIRELFRGCKRFAEIGRNLPITDKVLSERLKELEEHGIVQRTVYPDASPPRVEYTLTEKGKSLHIVLESMIEWGSKYA